MFAKIEPEFVSKVLEGVLLPNVKVDGPDDITVPNPDEGVPPPNIEVDGPDVVPNPDENVVVLLRNVEVDGLDAVPNPNEGVVVLLPNVEVVRTKPVPVFTVVEPNCCPASSIFCFPTRRWLLSTFSACPNEKLFSSPW